MNKSDLVNAVANAAGLTKADCAKATDELLALVSDSLKNGDGLQITGFGNFTITDRPERDGRNPRTGEAIKIPAARVVKFKPGKGLKDSVNA